MQICCEESWDTLCMYMLYVADWWGMRVQVFLMMMCSLKWGVFVFFGLWQTVALIFTILLVPETRGVPIEKASPLSVLKKPRLGAQAICWEH